MAMKRSAMASLLVVLLFALLLVLLNPTQADFRAWYTRKSSAASGPVIGAMSGAMVAVFSARTDYLLFSTFKAERGNVYLGFAKVIFIRLK